MTEAQLFHCPSCGAPLDIQGEARTVRCPYCHNSVIIPTAFQSLGDQTPALGDIHLLLANDKKIEAVKLLREMTGWGLQDAKNFVDALERGELVKSLEVLTGSAEPIRISSAGESQLSVTTISIQPPQARKAAVAFGLGTTFFTLALLCVILGSVAVPILIALTADGGPLAPLWSRINPAGFAAMDLILKGEGIAPGQFNDPRAIAVDRESNFYVSDYNTGRIQSFDAQGNFRWLVNLGNDVIIESMDVSPAGVLFVAAQGEIRRFQLSDGRELDPLPNPEEQSFYFEDLAFGPDGRLAVISQGEDLLIYNPELQLVITVPDAISSVTQDSELDCDVALDGLGNIYVLGTFNYKVLRFAPDGRYVNQFGGETTDEAPGKFRAPGEIAVDNQGRVYVSDIFGVQVFDGDGRYITKFDLVGYVFGMDFDLQNRMYIASNEPQVTRLILRK